MEKNLVRRYEKTKAEHDSIRKTMDELKARQVNLEAELLRLNTIIQIRHAFPHHSLGYPLYYR